MSLGSIDVNLYPIDRVNIKTPEGKRKLRNEIIKCQKRQPFPISVQKNILNKNIVNLYYIPVSPISNPPSKKSKLRIIRYRIVRRVIIPQTGKMSVYGYVTSVSK